MTRLPRITRTLSFRLSLTLLIALTTLLMVALIIMFIFSRMAVKEEASLKATQTLQATQQRIDNILLSVEQSAGNIYLNIINHIDQPEKMDTYCRKFVEGNPYSNGCCIAFEPDFYQNYPNLIVFYRKSGVRDNDGKEVLVEAKTESGLPYYKQTWYTSTLKKRVPDWLEPREENATNGEPVTVFTLPIYIKEKKAGVMAAGVPLNLLSKIVEDAKPSPNSFCALLGKDGAYIVHPDTTKLKFKNALSLESPTAKEAAKAMMAGETGYKKFKQNGKNYYVFYKPFERTAAPGRSMEKLNWSIGVIYPEDDIFGDYRRLHYTVGTIAAVGLLLLLLLIYTFIHRQLLPLRTLSFSAKRIADGHYDERIPNTRQQDEVGRLQKDFQHMQQALQQRVGEMDQLTQTLEERGKELQAAYELAQSGDRMKTNFLYNMSNQMISPISEICASVKAFKDQIGTMTEETNNELVENILTQGESITAMLRQLLNESEKKKENTE